MKALFKFVIYSLITLVSFVVFLSIILCFMLTSSGCFKDIILPVVSHFSGIPISAEAVHFSPFSSQIELKRFCVGSKDAPLLAAAKLRAAYNLRDILGGNIRVSELSIQDTYLHIKKNKNGEIVITGQTKAPDKAEVKTKAEQAAANKKPFITGFDISNINISNLNLTYEQENAGGTPTLMCINNLNVKMPSLKNNSENELELKAGLKVFAGEEINIQDGSVELKMKLKLDANNMPERLNMAAIVNKLSGYISKYEMSQQKFVFLANIEKEKDSYLINKFEFRELAGQELRSAITVDGSAAANPFALDLNINIRKISPQIIEFAQSMSNSDYRVGNADISYAGKLISSGGIYSAQGSMDIANITLRNIQNPSLAVQPLNLKLHHDISVNTLKKEAKIKNFVLEAGDAHGTFFEAATDRTAVISWGENTKSADFNSALKLKFNNLKLQLAAPFIPPSSNIHIKNGTLSGNLDTEIKLAQQLINLNGTLRVSDLSVKGSGLDINDLDIAQNINLQLKNNKLLTINTLRTEIRPANKSVAELQITGDMNLSTQTGKFSVQVPYMNEGTFSLLPEAQKNDPAIRKIFTDLAPFNFMAKSDIALDLNKTSPRISVSGVGLNLFSKREKIIGVSTDNPLFINLPTNTKPGVTFSPLKGSIASKCSLSVLNAFMASASPLKFQSGKMDTNVYFMAKDSFQNISLDGNILLDSAEFQTDPENIYADIDLKQKLKAEFNGETKSLKINLCETELLYKKNKALKASVEGALCFDPANNAGKLNIKIPYLNRNAIMLSPQLRKALTVKDLDMNADTVFAYNTKAGTMSLSGNINIPNIENDQIPKPVKSNMIVDFTKTADKIELKKFNCRLADSSSVLADLDASANIFTRPGAGKSSISISSDKIDLAAIESFFNKEEKNTQRKTAQQTKKQTSAAKDTGLSPLEKEPAAVEALKGLDIEAKIALKNVSYGNDFKSELNSNITIKDSTVTISKTVLALNKTPISCEGAIDLGQSDGYTYYFKSNFTKLALPPIFKTFIKNNYASTKGEISYFSCAIKGKGFTSVNLARNLKGFISSDFKDIAIPNEMKDNEFVSILFMIVELTSQGVNNLDKITDPSSLVKSLDFSKTTVGNGSTLDFSEGEFKTTFDGKIQIDKLYFKGDLISYLKVNGTVGFDKKLKINSETKVSGIMVPLKIGGTTDKPEPNMPDFFENFFKKNTKSLLDAVNTDDLGNLIGGKVGNAIKNINLGN